MGLDNGLTAAKATLSREVASVRSGDASDSSFLPILGLGPVSYQFGTDCIIPVLTHIDTLIHLFVFVAPIITVTLFGVAELSDRFLAHRRYKYYLSVASSSLLRVSAMLVVVGLLMFVFVAYLAPESLQVCSRYGG